MRPLGVDIIPGQSSAATRSNVRSVCSEKKMRLFKQTFREDARCRQREDGCRRRLLFLAVNVLQRRGARCSVLLKCFELDACREPKRQVRRDFSCFRIAWSVCHQRNSPCPALQEEVRQNVHTLLPRCCSALQPVRGTRGVESTNAPHGQLGSLETGSHIPCETPSGATSSSGRGARHRLVSDEVSADERRRGRS